MFRNHGYNPVCTYSINKNLFCLAVCDRGKPINILAECVDSGYLISMLFKTTQQIFETQRRRALGLIDHILWPYERWPNKRHVSHFFFLSPLTFIPHLRSSAMRLTC